MTCAHVALAEFFAMEIQARLKFLSAWNVMSLIDKGLSRFWGLVF